MAAARVDPYRSFRFRVEFDQVQHGGFVRAKGLVRETKVDSYREGGVNDFEHKFANVTTFGPLVLEHGLADDYLWKWHEDVIQGQIKRRTVTLSLHDETDAEVWRWVFEAAFPTKWSGSDLDAGTAQVLVESVELTHHGFKRG
jgi:phage tail-like protein